MAPNSLFPKLETRQDFRRFKADRFACESAIRAIAARHGLEKQPIQFFNNGSLIVCALGSEWVLKLYSPFFPTDMTREALVLRHCHRQLSIATPGVHFCDVREGWPYLIMDKLQGVPLLEKWETLAEETRESLCQAAGHAMKELHSLPLKGLETLAAESLNFKQLRIANVEAHHQAKNTDDAWLKVIRNFICKVDWEGSPFPGPALLHTEFMRDHLMIRQQQGQWQLSGLIDFEPALIGEPEYDLASVALFISAGSPKLLKAFLRGYGYKAHEQERKFQERLLAQILIHCQSNMPWYLSFMPKPDEISIEALIHAWLGLE